MYGETSFELICQILDKLHPITGNNKFVDLGSGVGQVVLQVAALTNCSISLGIEKANTPAKYAEVRSFLIGFCPQNFYFNPRAVQNQDMEKWFRFWMSFYGKTFSPFKLVHSDFLLEENKEEVLQSTIVFVNNFAFGPGKGEKTTRALPSERLFKIKNTLSQRRGGPAPEGHLRRPERRRQDLLQQVLLRPQLPDHRQEPQR